MKEHPVDKFFSEKLNDLEVTPSEDVWGKIEHHLEEKKTPWGFYYGIAASFVVILAIFSYVLLQPKSSPIERQYFQRDNSEMPITNSSDNRPKSVQPSGTVPGSENSIPVMAQQDQKETIKKHTSLHRKVIAMADYEGDEYEFSENTIYPIDPIEIEKKKERKFSISIANSSKYLEQNDEPEDTRYREKLKGYTVAQWDNINQRRKLDAPPLPNVKFPKLKFERSRSTAQ
jgi:hypothetical protein